MSLHVAPEIEARVRELASARGVSVEVLLDEAVQLMERSLPRAREQKAEAWNSSREMAWVANPDLRYVNQWVVLDGDKVIAHGPKARDVVREARSKGVVAPFLHFVPEPNLDPLFMGWLGSER